MTAGLAEAIEHGFLVERDGAVGFRHELIGTAVERGPAPARPDAPPRLAGGGPRPTCPPRPPGTGSRPTTRPAARRTAIEAADLAAARHAAADELDALELALSLSDLAGTAAGPPRGGVDDVRGSDRADLQERAAEAAFAIGRTSRATAYLEAAIGALDARRDRIRIGLLYERLGVVRRAAGDAVGARAAARRAVELIPRDATPERATVLASFAQMSMLDGLFSDAQRLARDAIKVARACGPAARDQEIHATTTLAVALAWGSDPNAAIELLREAETAAREVDDPDALFRVTANLTTVLDLVGRRAEAVDVAYRGIEDARQRRSRGRLRQLPRRQRHGIAGPAGPLAGSAAPQRARPGVAADRGGVPDGHRPARDDRDRDRVGRAGRPAARPDRARVRRAARAAAGGAVLPRGRVVRAVARRRRRRAAGPSSAAGPSCARPRSGSSPRG